MSDTKDPDSPGTDDARQLVHEIKNQLYIINMGLEVLRGARQNEEEFAKVVASIRRDGIEPLKSTMTRLIELATRPAAEQAPPRAQRKAIREAR